MKKIAGLVMGLFLCGSAWAANPQVEMTTSEGSIVIELFADKVPKTVDNFLQYAKSSFYQGTIFHRVIPGFMAQGGGFTRTFEQKATRSPIPIESATGLKNNRGTIAMARMHDPNSANAQFFINVADNGALNYSSQAVPGYAVFGIVVKGMDVVDKIIAIPTGSGGPFPTDVPKKEVVIEDIKLLEEK